MKNICKTFIVTFVAIIAMTACSPDSLLENDNMNPTQQTMLQGRDLANNLLASFSNNVTRNAELNYPNYYGGMFFDEKGQLNILSVSENPDKYREEFIQRCQGDNFILKSCKYSLNELNNGIEIIRELLSTAPQASKTLGLKSFWLSDNKSELHIGLSDCSDENINYFKTTIADLPYIVFEQVDKIEYQAEQIDAGSPINSKNGISQSSLGYRAICNGEKGFVVAAHAMISMGTVSLYDAPNWEIGQCKKIDKTVDAAFCTLFSSYTPSNTTFEGVSLTSDIETVIFGDKVSICGHHSSGSGTVLSTNYNYVGPEGNAIYGGVQATYTSQNGDSGAVIYTASKNIAGMHSAGVTTSGTKSAIFIPAAAINRALSLTMY